jgi:hypothetical protein
MTHYEIINPSDKVLVTAADDMIAAVAVLVLGRGRYGLRRDNGDLVLPVFLLGGADEWIAEKGIADLEAYLKEHAAELAAVFESVFYGGVRDLKALEAALEGASPEAAARGRAKYNDTKRSSLNNIGAACAEYAARLRELAAPQAEPTHKKLWWISWNQAADPGRGIDSRPLTWPPPEPVLAFWETGVSDRLAADESFSTVVALVRASGESEAEAVVLAAWSPGVAKMRFNREYDEGRPPGDRFPAPAWSIELGRWPWAAAAPGPEAA